MQQVVDICAILLARLTSSRSKTLAFIKSIIMVNLAIILKLPEESEDKDEVNGGSWASTVVCVSN